MTPADALARAVRELLAACELIDAMPDPASNMRLGVAIGVAKARLTAYEAAPKGVVVCEGRCDPLDLEWREDFRDRICDLGLNGERIRLLAEKAEDGDA